MSLVEPAEVPPVGALGRVHMIGIGGVGMSGIARILLDRGVRVSGSDARDSVLLDELRTRGVRGCAGHDARNLGELGDGDTLVVSTAIRPDNPELVEARRRGMRVLPRAAALASLMADRRGVAIAGTHGKTTTTSMLTVVAQHAGTEPGYVIGGQLVATGVGAADGAGSLFLAEADESDGSFLMLAPYGAVVTNIEADHLDNYASIEEILAGFAAFVDRIDPAGFLVVCTDDPNAAALAVRARGRGLRVLGYGTADSADVRVTTVAPAGLGMTFAVDGTGEYTLAVPGRHNVLNAAAVIAVARALGLPDDAVRAGLAAFGGAARRFEPKGEAGDVAVYDSYAHHPTELTADLAAARDLATARGGRVIAVFQPHLYSRTRIFAAEFGAALGGADHAVVLDVYPAREDPIPGVTGELIADRVPGAVTYQPDRAGVVETVAEIAAPTDVVVTMGAGDVTALGPLIIDALRDRAAAAR